MRDRGEHSVLPYLPRQCHEIVQNTDEQLRPNAEEQRPVVTLNELHQIVHHY